MPVVRYDQQQATPAALPQARVSPQAPAEAFGGGAAATAAFGASGALAKQAEGLLLQEKKAADDTAFLEHDTAASKLQTDLELKARQFKGKDAGAAPEMVSEEWRKGTDEILKNAGNNEQRMQLQRSLALRQQNLDKSVNIHVATEVDKHEDDVSNSSIQSARDEAITNFDQPDRVEQSIFQQQQVVERVAARKGLDPVQREAALMEVSSKTHVGVIGRMLAQGQDLNAKKWYDDNKDGIAGSYKDDLDKAMKIGSIRGESTRQADAIVGKYSSMSDALAEVKKISDPEVRDATNQRVKQAFDDKASARRADQEQMFQANALRVEQEKSMDSVPPDELAKMTAQERESLRGILEKARTGVDSPPNGEVYYNLMTMASSPELKSKFLQENLMLYSDKVSRSEMHELIGIQTSARKGLGADDKKLDGFRTNTQIVNDILNSAGIDPTPKPGTSDAIRANQFRARLDQDLAEQQRKTGKEATNEEVKALAEGLMIKVRSDRGFFGNIINSWIPWDTSKKAFELEIKDVPPRDRSLIEQALRKNNRPVNDRAIIQYFIRGQNAGK